MRSVLDLKLLRDLWHIRGQAFAIAVVIACGVATVVMAFGVQRSLELTRAAYYDRNGFADVFASLKRAPMSVLADVSALPGVATVDGRIVRGALLDVPGAMRPSVGRLVSLPRTEGGGLNRVTLRWGRLPRPREAGEAVASEAFAAAHGLKPGSVVSANLNGKKRKLAIVGVGLSPEYVYAIGPGLTIPDDEAFGILWLDADAMEAAFALESAFDDLALTLLRGANEQAVIEGVDRILAPYGGLGAIGREDHLSNAYLDAELEQLGTIGSLIPPIFLAVSAFLLNFVLSRLLDTEREQIGLMKSFGYSGRTIAGHYLKLVLLIAAAGALFGVLLGAWLGHAMTGLYTRFYHFPLLHYELDIVVLVGAVLAAFLVAVLGAAGALRRAMALAPAIAMRPPPPPVYRRSLTELLGLSRALSPHGRMIARHIERWPVRAGVTSLGVGASIALMVSTLFFFDAVELMIDVFYYRVQHHDASVEFTDERGPGIVHEVARLPGVLAAEAYRAAPVRLVHGSRSERTGLIGIPEDGDMRRLLDEELNSVSVPPEGIALSVTLSRRLGVGLGDTVEVRALQGRRNAASLRVAALVEEFVGETAYMEAKALDAFLGAPYAVTGARLVTDEAHLDELYAAVTEVPAIAGLTDRRRAVASFRASYAESMNIALLFYVGFAAAITVGVVYNAARISLSERARDLATLRVLGFTKVETAVILLGEFAILVCLALPLGCLFGYAIAAAMTSAFESNLFRIPLVITVTTYSNAMLVGIGAACLSALLVARRIGRLDLIAVLKTRD
ncbi:MAG: FtsX-like permease family protein [Alphaproteobacteria bacterium]|nr:FtsX-like permease family protein [Alphaproteobacteria bacterium]